MAKKKQQIGREPEKTAAEYYQLKTKAVDDLVNATEANSPPVSKQELRKYRSAAGIKLAGWVKAVLIKAWMAGIVCYFFIWGVGMYVSDQLDLLMVTAVALGFVTDIVTNNIFRFIAKPENANDRWMMIPPKKFVSLPLNVLYAFAVMFCVVQTYNLVNTVIVAINHAEEAAVLGVEPILFGLFAMGWDMLFIGAKRLFKRILSDAKNSARSS